MLPTVNISTTWLRTSSRSLSRLSSQSWTIPSDSLTRTRMVSRVLCEKQSIQTHSLLCFVFSPLNPGKVDKSTWAGVDFMPLLTDIWQKVGIHSHHQQRCENYVQLAALIAKTLVGEARRTWRAIALSTTIRRFNLETLNAARAKESDPEKRKNIRRARGTERIRLLHIFVEEFMAIVKRAKEQLPEGKYQTIFNNIAKTDNKASADEKQAFIDEFLEIALLVPPKNMRNESLFFRKSNLCRSGNAVQ